MNRIRTALVTVALLAMLGVSAIVAQEFGEPHFVEFDGGFGSPELHLRAKEVGLGNNQGVTWEFGANNTAVYVCVNRGGNIPPSPKKIQVAGPVVDVEQLPPADKNGNITGTGMLVPKSPPADFSCPGSQTMKLACVRFATVKVKDVTNSTPTKEISAGLSQTFYQVFIVLPPDCPATVAAAATMAAAIRDE
jgi:hypothetical protein